MIGKMLNINLIVGQADNLSVTNFPLNTQLCLYALIITNKSYTRHALIICVLIHAYKWFYAFYRLNLLWTFRVRLTIFASRWMMSWEMEESWKRWSNLEMACLYPTVLQYWVLQYSFALKSPDAVVICQMIFVLPEPLRFLFLPQVHYSGFLEYSEEPFETNTNLKYPKMMKLGRGQ